MILTFQSCTPIDLVPKTTQKYQKHKKTKAQRKLAKLVKKYPELKNDSVNTNVTYSINFKGFKRDTLYKPGKDTLIIRENNTVIKHFHNTVTGEDYLSAEARDTILKGDTIIKTPQLQVYNPTLREEIDSLLTSPIVIITFIILLVLFVLNKLSKKFF